jgi:hypothetical protein
MRATCHSHLLIITKQHFKVRSPSLETMRDKVLTQYAGWTMSSPCSMTFWCSDPGRDRLNTRAARPTPQRFRRLSVSTHDPAFPIHTALQNHMCSNKSVSQMTTMCRVGQVWGYRGQCDCMGARRPKKAGCIFDFASNVFCCGNSHTVNVTWCWDVRASCRLKSHSYTYARSREARRSLTTWNKIRRQKVRRNLHFY